MENLSPSLSICDQNHFSDALEPALANIPSAKQATLLKCYVSIISNSHLLREAIMSLLEANEFGYLFTYYTGDAKTMPKAISSKNHLVLLDSGIGQTLTMTRIREWRSLDPVPLIVVLELKHDTDLILDCIEAGAHAYALQSASSTDITQVIEQVSQGIFQCSPEITAKLFDRLTQSKKIPQPPAKSPLTRRELEVLHHVARELSDREIATQLVIEVRTVKHHVHNILQKLKVRNRWDAAQLALKNCWLDPIPS